PSVSSAQCLYPTVTWTSIPAERVPCSTSLTTSCRKCRFERFSLFLNRARGELEKIQVERRPNISQNDSKNDQTE
ncbi:hypothetical protein PFISCL1PPCAC_13506, partial [Pristionchus fissidentatus]